MCSPGNHVLNSSVLPRNRATLLYSEGAAMLDPKAYFAQWQAAAQQAAHVMLLLVRVR